MRITRALTGVALLGAMLLGAGGAAGADSPSPSSSADSESSSPTSAGSTFRTATQIQQDTKATASASTGDYLYWAFPADAGQRPTVHATVELPKSAARHSDTTWQIDVYDGLRRHQPCMYGRQSHTAGSHARSVKLSCVLRPVRGWADTWSNDPLPGSYYLRLTVTDLKPADLGLPMSAEVTVDSKNMGGAQAVDGSLATPLVPHVGAATSKDGEDDDADTVRADAAPSDGWSSGWWSDRWVWSGIGGVVAALTAVGGYTLTRRPRRRPRGPVDG